MSDSLYTVYTGRWTDWSSGRVWGDQITLTSRDGQILIGFIAIFISFVGSLAWSILSFLIHQSRISSRPRRAFDHQLQVLLRNCGSAPIFSKNSFKVGWAWRKKSRSATVRAFGFASLSSAVFLVFIVAGILLSLVARQGFVLILPDDCKILPMTPSLTGFTPFQVAEFDAITNDNFLKSLAYTSSCYRPPSELPFDSQNRLAPTSDCEFFNTPNITYAFQSGVPCPFEKHMCRTDEPVVRMDTGRINSNDMLGINAPVENQVDIQMRVTCAPLNDTKYTSTKNGNTTFHFGGNPLVMPGHARKTFSSYLVDIPEETFKFPKTAPYSVLDPFQMWVANQNIFYQPILELSRADATVILLFLSNRAVLSNDDHDFWFGADARDKTVFSWFGEQPVLENVTIWRSTKAGAVVGCAQQMRYCNPAQGGTCTPFSALVAELVSKSSTRLFHLNEIQNFILDRYISVLPYLDISSPFWYLGPSALDAQRYLTGPFGICAPIPKGQWQVELAHFFSTSLAQLQRNVFETNLGAQGRPSLKNMTVKLPEPLCKSMKVKDRNYLSFRVIWLGLIFGLGGGVILISLAINLFLPRFQSRISKRGEIARDEWTSQEVLQMMRAIYELGSLGSWQGDPGKTPVELTLGKLPSVHSAGSIPEKDEVTTSINAFGSCASESTVGLDSSDSIRTTE